MSRSSVLAVGLSARRCVWIVAAVVACLAGCAKTTRDVARLRINEVMARNRAFDFVDANGAHLDWVEIYNPTDASVDLAGYTLSDNANRPFKYRFPARSLAPGAHLVLFLASSDDVLEFERPDPDTGAAQIFRMSELHADFGVGSVADDLFLFGAEGAQLVDRIEIHRLATDVSAGRFPDGADAFGPIYAPTPGRANVQIGLRPAEFIAEPRVGRPPSAEHCRDIPLRFRLAQDGGTPVLPDVHVELITLGDECDFFATGTPAIVEVGAPLSIAERAENPDCVPSPPAPSSGAADIVDPDDGCRRDAAGRIVVASIRELDYAVTLPEMPCLTTRVLIRVVVDDGLLVTTSRPFCYVYGGQDPPLVINEYQPRNSTSYHFLCENCNRDSICCAGDCNSIFDPDCRAECLSCREFDGYGVRRVLTPDWIEVYNYGDEALDIREFGLRGRRESAGQAFTTWQFGASTGHDPEMASIEPGGLLVVLADDDRGEIRRVYRRLLPAAGGGFSVDRERKYYSTPFKLDPTRATIDEILLQSDAGSVIDQVLLDFRAYAEANGLALDDTFLEDRAAGRFPDDDPTIPEGAIGADRYPANHLAPGIVTECPTLGAPNALDCGVDVPPTFRLEVVTYPRCPEPGESVSASTRIAVDRDAAAVDVDVHYTLLPSGNRGVVASGAGVEVARSADQSGAPVGTLLYDVDALLPGFEAGTIVEFEFRATVVLPSGTAEARLGAGSAEAAGAHALSFRYAVGSLAPRGLRFSEVLPQNESTPIPGANIAAPPDFLEIELSADAAVDEVDLSGWFLTHQNAPESPSTPILAPRYWPFPEGTMIRRGELVTAVFGRLAAAAPGFVEVDSFGLDGCGEVVYLIGPDSDGNCIADAISWWNGFGPNCVEDELGRSSADDVSIGRLCGGDDHRLLAVPTPGAPNTLPPRLIGVSHLPFAGDGANPCAPGAVRIEVQFLVDRQIRALGGDQVVEAFVETEDGTVLRRLGNVTSTALPASYPAAFDLPLACRDARVPCYEAFTFQSQANVTTLTRFRVVVTDACGGSLVPCGDDFCFSLGAGAERTEGLRINEINRRSALPGSGAVETRHWIELVNTSGAAIDLSAMSLSNDTRQPRLAMLPDGAMIAAGEHLVVVTDGLPLAGDLPHLVVDLPWAQVFPSGSRRCRRSGRLLLYDAVDRGSCLLDRAIFDFVPTGGGGDPACGADPNCVVCDARSLVPDPGGSDVFVEGEGPTPGAPNSTVVEVVFVRGDTDQNRRIDIRDAVAVLGYLFRGVPYPCLDVLDADDSSRVEISDATYLLNYVFQSGNAPLPPFPEPGVDPTPDALDCVGGSG